MLLWKCFLFASCPDSAPVVGCKLYVTGCVSFCVPVILPIRPHRSVLTWQPLVGFSRALNFPRSQNYGNILWEKPGQPPTTIPRLQWFPCMSSGTLVTMATCEPLIMPGPWWFTSSSVFATAVSDSGLGSHSSAPALQPEDLSAGGGTRSRAQELPRRWEGEGAAQSQTATPAVVGAPARHRRGSVLQALEKIREQGSFRSLRFF